KRPRKHFIHADENTNPGLTLGSFARGGMGLCSRFDFRCLEFLARWLRVDYDAVSHLEITETGGPVAFQEFCLACNLDSLDLMGCSLDGDRVCCDRLHRAHDVLFVSMGPKDAARKDTHNQ